MKYSCIITGAFLLLSKLTFATSLANGVYVCTNDDEAIVARVSFVGESGVQVDLDGEKFSLMKTPSSLIRVIEGENAIAVQINPSLTYGETFAQLAIRAGANQELTGRLLVGDRLSLEGYNMSCSHF